MFFVYHRVKVFLGSWRDGSHWKAIGVVCGRATAEIVLICKVEISLSLINWDHLELFVVGWGCLHGATALFNDVSTTWLRSFTAIDILGTSCIAWKHWPWHPILLNIIPSMRTLQYLLLSLNHHTLILILLLLNLDMFYYLIHFN